MPELDLLIVLGTIGSLSGFLSGLLGIGGGIVLTPLLLYVPPLLGYPILSIKIVAGLTIVQGILGCLVGAISHRKFHFLSVKLAIYMGATIFLAAFVGAAGSKYIPGRVLLIVFAFLALTAAVLILIPKKEDPENPDVNRLTFSRLRAVGSALGVGIFGGMVGQGGSFILIPLMTSFVQIPTRIAIGSNLAIILFSSLAGFLGKAFTGQIKWILTIPLVLTVIPAARLGSLISRKVPVKVLRKILAIIIVFAAIRIGISAFSG
ncbi:MAG TPA: sulfite exporter TauE/SafE family protein [bacterium]|nr:sulfite exporter TauE/SafE family protein [bacterium]